MTSGRCARLVPFALVICFAGPPILWADVFPGPGSTINQGSHQGIYMVIRDVNDAPLSQSRINLIRASEVMTRQFYAANSGGAYGIRYPFILDVPLTLNSDRTRPAGWFGLAESYVRNTFGIEPEGFHLNVFDVNATTPDPGQGWAGIAIIPGNNIAIQADINSNWGQLVVDHEQGHRVGAPHSGAWRTLNDSNYTSYVWNLVTERYEVYSAATHGHQATAYGVHYDEYGNPFDVMGNINREQFSVHEKLTNLNWLTNTQVPDLGTLGADTYRIYAHDELVTVQDRNGNYGVENTYDPSVLYGLTYSREAERFNPAIQGFEPTNQTITLEYRSGRDGVQFYLNDAILDLNLEGGTDRNNRERELEVGQAIEDIEFGMLFYRASGEGDNFLSYNPPPPTNFWEIAPQWFEFSVLGTASDQIGSYIDVNVSIIDSFKAGDLNDDGFLTVADVQMFTSNWLSDTTGLNHAEQNARGDLNFNGRVDQDDWVLMRKAFANLGLALSGQMLVPEPTTGALILSACIGVCWGSCRSCRRGG